MTDPDPDPVVAEAAAVLAQGGLVALPTETVYGLGADATNPAAVARIFTVKGRPSGHPLIVHLADASWLDRWTVDVPPGARALAARCWPGPLTMLLWRHPDVPIEVTGGRDTVGVRVPDHGLTRAVIAALGHPVAAPSANRFGHVSPTSADDVRADLGDAVDLIVDGGRAAVGVESTIVDLTGDEPTLLRPGAVSVADLEAVLGVPVRDGAVGPSRAPGMLASHYAPRCSVRLAPDRSAAERLAGPGDDVLDPQVDAATWAHELYRWLRDADARGVRTLVVVPPADEGLGAAVNDRLRKAAAPRP